MIVNPYSEVISLHDMNFNDFKIENGNCYISLESAYLYTSKDDYILDNPLVIANDLNDIVINDDYPIRIKLISGSEVISLSIDEFKNYNFNILEEAYGFGLVHFYGIAINYMEEDGKSYDCFIDIHYTGDLEIKWDDKILLEA